MKEKKFRVWDKEKKRFLQPDEFFIGASGCIYRMIDFLDITDKTILIQYAGHKDKNDNEIYEGHIVKETLSDELLKVKPKYYQKKMIYVCITGNGGLGDCTNGFIFKPIITKCERKFIHHIKDDCEIIGNIYENPELIE